MAIKIDGKFAPFAQSKADIAEELVNGNDIEMPDTGHNVVLAEYYESLVMEFILKRLTDELCLYYVTWHQLNLVNRANGAYSEDVFWEQETEIDEKILLGVGLGFPEEPSNVMIVDSAERERRFLAKAQEIEASEAAVRADQEQDRE